MGAPLTTESFIEKANKVHNYKYIYSGTTYKGALSEVDILCPIHGGFSQRANSHLFGEGCRACGIISQQRKVADSQETFIEKANKAHNFKYDYSYVKYKNSQSIIKIICPEHGEFDMNAGYHVSGGECEKCAVIHRKLVTTYTTEEFIEKAKKVHGDKYDYAISKYTGSNDDIDIICKTHGKFTIQSTKHLRGQGCYICSDCKLSNDEYIAKAKLQHGDKYDYSVTVYDTTRKDIKILCTKHGEFVVNAGNHIRCGGGCKVCDEESKILKFIQKSNIIHNNRYDYSKITGMTSDRIVDIICPIHGVFKQNMHGHSQGKGCNKCRESRGEKMLEEYLLYHSINFERQVKFDGCKYKQVLFFDFYLPELNICIEFDGMQHYIPIGRYGGEKTFEKIQLRDQIKTTYCAENGIELIRIRYDEVDDLDDLIDIMDELFGLRSYDDNFYE